LDFITPDFYPEIGFIKDLAAGAVLVASITALVIGGFIFIPKIL
jgi:diacylglycerol kinase